MPLNLTHCSFKGQHDTEVLIVLSALIAVLLHTVLWSTCTVHKGKGILTTHPVYSACNQPAAHGQVI